MKYLTAFKAKAKGSVGFVGTFAPIHAEYHDDEIVSKEPILPTLPYLTKIRSDGDTTKHTRSYGYPPTEPTKPANESAEPGSVGFVGFQWSRPEELASWPVERRQQWGELANELEAAGIPWPEHERQAYERIKTECGVAA